VGCCYYCHLQQVVLLAAAVRQVVLPGLLVGIFLV